MFRLKMLEAQHFFQLDIDNTKVCRPWHSHYSHFKVNPWCHNDLTLNIHIQHNCPVVVFRRHLQIVIHELISCLHNYSLSKNVLRNPVKERSLLKFPLAFIAFQKMLKFTLRFVTRVPEWRNYSSVTAEDQGWPDLFSQDFHCLEQSPCLANSSSSLKSLVNSCAFSAVRFWINV